ncbi:MAG: (2Fe-2S)-binding protein [Treponema sp.]|jgi:iron only hydrogenase large subunit-like protein|nr:(2Fe-2S)-binding protein [Treponema sp.]
MSHHQPDPNKSVTLTIDGKPVTVPEGTRILEAAKKANVNIPTLCEHPELCKRALCRICVVEADGRGKLIAACANDVWEGVSIVTTNQRLLNIRKTIVELILANHPQDCLSCIRNKKCELQSLALSFGIGASLFENDAQERQPQIESETLVRNMDKCVKCGRCVEVCQEVQTIRAINTSHRSYEYEISTPYKQALEESFCTFCGKCAEVCPVGAIYEHDQTAEVRAALNDKSRKVIAQVSPNLAVAVNDELALSADTITTGKLITAIKLLGFDKVFDASIAENAVNAEIAGEVKQRGNGGKLLPVISGCSEGVANFIKNFYPDLADHLTTVKSSRRYFASSIKSGYAKETGVELSNITSVSFLPCLAHKYGAGSPQDFAITAKELVRMLKLAGIVVETLAETSFDNINIDLPKQESSVKKETVHGYAQARKVMEAIRDGKCETEWVEILNCPESDSC